MTTLIGRTRATAALLCSAVIGIAVPLSPAAASTATVLTMNGSSVTGAAYAGTQPQSFSIVKQADGSFGIRSFYQGTNSVLDMNGSSVAGKPYAGTQPQSFSIVKQADGSFGIRGFYQNVVLTMTNPTVSGQAYQGTQNQSFELVRQADGSWGIRAFYPGPSTVPQAPQARNDAASTAESQSVDIDVLANDSGTGTTQPLDLTIAGISTPGNGTVNVVNGKIRYTPNSGFAGCDSFTYTIEDIFGQRSTATVRIAVSAVNHLTAQQISGTALTVSGNGFAGTPYQNGNGAQKFALVRQNDGSWGLRNPASNLVLATNNGSVNAAPYDGSPSQSFNLYPQGDGSTGIRNTYSGDALNVYSNTGAVSSGPYTGVVPQSLELVDQGDGTYSVLTYYGSTQVPQLPIARTDGASTVQGTATTVDVLANDTNAGRTDSRGLSLTAVSAPANGTAETVSGQVRYTPQVGFTGCDTFTYTVTDVFGRSTTGTVNVAVAARLP
ncbi:Ig-like domain-containing protein [Kitasatospora sp. NPDC048286]|uniref:Ig-like domain-containing protein n=1 Tax=Kitasatospora sp. NPDC048286 TaxID=3364047 RepID=UPI00371C2996